MIYTVTLNPSVDYIVHVENFAVGGLNRSTYDQKYPGGKGINVSRLLKRHGVESKALGFIGGLQANIFKIFYRTNNYKQPFTRCQKIQESM